MRLLGGRHGTRSLLWALGLALFLWLGARAVGVAAATAAVLAAVGGFAIFLFVRFYGADEVRRP